MKTIAAFSALLLAILGVTTPAWAVIEQVPEPSALSIMAIGGLGFWAFHRLRRRS
ncbi:MAG TPA: PEP-CTERM sorting domain-containing protein [Vicinamibacterales bacterium]|nr:PEP-CTERM sorting domain-containing protein [Vicinamibacterales bacterium]